MPIRKAGEYLHRWGFTPRKPKKRAFERNPVEVKRWLDEEYPSIAPKGRRRGRRYNCATRPACAAFGTRQLGEDVEAKQSERKAPPPSSFQC